MMELDEAGRWFAALRRGVMTLDEQANYAVWRRDRRNRAAMAKLEKVWTGLEIARAHVTENTGEGAQADKTRQRFFRSAQVAAVIGIVVLGVGISYSTNTQAWSVLDWSNL